MHRLDSFGSVALGPVVVGPWMAKAACHKPRAETNRCRKRCPRSASPESPRRLSFDQLADGVIDDVANNVFRRVIDAAGLANFRLFFDGCALVSSDDDLAKKALVDAAQNVNRNGVEIVGRARVREALGDLVKDVLVDFETVAVEQAVLFEDDSVVDAIESARSRDEILPGLSRLMQVFD